MDEKRKNCEGPSLSGLDGVLMPAQHDALSGSTTVTTINQQWFQDKLRALRISQRQLAKRIDLDPAAVSNMLQGKRRMTMDEAKAIAEHLLVPVTEVMRQAGIDVTDDVRKVPVAGHVGPGSVVTLMPHGTHDQAIAPADVPSGSFAVQTRIVTSSSDGWLYFVSGIQQPPSELLDRLSVVALTDGRLLSAILRRGYKQRLFNLVLLPEGGVLENQEVAWAAHVLWIQPT
jgi:hypothetical protein